MSIDNFAVVVTPNGVKAPGGGYDSRMPQPVYRRASTETAQYLNAWWGAGGGAPAYGMPCGHTTRDGRAAAMHCDPYSWFKLGKYISSAGQAVIGLNGRGKSFYIKRTITYYDGLEILTMVLGDIKGEYCKQIAELAPRWTGDPRGIPGQVISLGMGRDALNPLDMGDAPAASARIITKGDKDHDGRLVALGKQLLLDAKIRRRLCLEAIFTAIDGQSPDGFEIGLLGVALGILDTEWKGEDYPLPSDLLAVFRRAPEKLKDAAEWRGDDKLYWAAVDHLIKTLATITRPEEDLGMGAVFNRPTTTAIRRDTHVCFDMSGVHKDEKVLRAALQVTCWTLGFGAIAVSHALSDAGLERFQRYHAVQDELWNAFLAGSGMVERHNEMTRLDRHEGLITTKCTHSLGDNKMLSEEDQAKALGMFARTPLLICFAIDPAEEEFLRDLTRFSDAEIEHLLSLSDTEDWAAPAGNRPPGNGHAAAKVGRKPMVPFEIDASPTELVLYSTNARWDD